MWAWFSSILLHALVSWASRRMFIRMVRLTLHEILGTYSEQLRQFRRAAEIAP
jgi:hypothetical protein